MATKFLKFFNLSQHNLTTLLLLSDIGLWPPWPQTYSHFSPGWLTGLIWLWAPWKRSVFHLCGLGRANANFLKECHRKNSKKEHRSSSDVNSYVTMKYFDLCIMKAGNKVADQFICCPPAKFGFRYYLEEMKGKMGLLTI